MKRVAERLPPQGQAREGTHEEASSLSLFRFSTRSQGTTAPVEQLSSRASEREQGTRACDESPATEGASERRRAAADAGESLTHKPRV